MMADASGSPEAERLTALFRVHHDEVRRFARRRVGADVSEEIVAETFMVAWRRIRDVPDPALPWLYKVASYRIGHYQRREEQASRLVLRVAGQRQIAQEPMSTETNSLSEAVERAFNVLRPADQEVLRLSAWEGLSAREGAAVLGCSASAYRVRLHRATRRLARLCAVEVRREARLLTEAPNQNAGSGWIGPPRCVGGPEVTR